MSFRVTINTDNDAFGDPTFQGGATAASETARILRDIAGKLEAGIHDGAAYDHNGNRVGEFKLTASRHARNAAIARRVSR
jgi:hypothetical protein